MTPDEILAAFQRNVRRLDNWRGYLVVAEDSPTDDQVHEVLQRARDCMATVGERTHQAFMRDLVPAEELYDAKTRIAELERQRDEVLALCDEADEGIPEAIFRGARDWAGLLRALYGGGE